MRYAEFKAAVYRDLKANPDGLTWKELRERNRLPYTRPCPTWTKCLQEEIGLNRVKKLGKGNELVWMVEL